MSVAGTQSDGSRALRVAVIGYGAIGGIHARAIESVPGAMLSAICEVDPARRRLGTSRFAVPGYERVEEMLAREQPDAVTIATPDHLHVEPALAAIGAGCHVFCEKPLATSVRAAQQIVNAASRQGVHLSVDYNRRFMSGYRQAHKWLRTWWVGEMDHCLLRVTDPTPPPEVARHPYVMLDTLLTHHLDLVRWYGGEICRLHAHVLGRRDKLVCKLSLSIELRSGATATIVASYSDQQERTSEWLALHRANGSIVVEEMALRVVMSDKKPDGCFVMEFEPNGNPLEASVTAHVRAFVARLAAGHKPAINGHDGLVAARLAAAAVKSINSGKTIEV